MRNFNVVIMNIFLIFDILTFAIWKIPENYQIRARGKSSRRGDRRNSPKSLASRNEPHSAFRWAPSPAECQMRLIAARWRFRRVPAISAAARSPARANLIVFWDFPNCKIYDIKNRKNIHNYNVKIPHPTMLVRHRSEPSSRISDFGADPAHCAKRTMSLRRPIAPARPPMGH